MPNGARLVGYALRALGGRSTVPWQRVVNAQGRISPRADGRPADEVQRLLLEAEGVRFDAHGRIPLERYGWQPHPAELTL
jgi:methylated-DNA-protein-cysteine methyltransferase-like protein